ncbi:MAG: glycoside hydrolase family 3 C-terminal domain-containing protein [Lachnospiraceae bacterium]|nr:glycoside hydrolase family 3 C-terminal domain-containing protein [Lachnospiraceae bacterium]
MDIKELLSKLTADEKIRLLGGDGAWHTYGADGKIPVIMMTDGPHGLRKVAEEKSGDIENSIPATCFPTASAVAASWNPEVAAKMACAIAKEAKSEQVSIVLGPGTNIKRSPLCGRNFEYYSEDPFLAGTLATAYIKSMQNEGVGTSLKHFAANSQETRRMTSNSQVDERALREIYLSAFEMAVKEARPATLMCSYNCLNGEYASRNKHLLTEILRDDWGYEGAVVSDWGATNKPVECFKAGLSLEMPDPNGYHTKELKKAYREGRISDDELNKWAEAVLTNFSALSEKVDQNASADLKAHNNIAREIEDECAVLLKNDGTLPIAKDKKLIVIGELADHMRFQGGGSSHINAAFKKNAIDALKDAGYEVTYVQGYKNDTDVADPTMAKEAIDTIRNVYKKGQTVILFFLGLTESYEGEGYDRTDINIPANQTELLEAVSSLAERNDIAAISFGGAPMDFSWEKNVSAILHMYLGGQAVGEAVADLVSGRANPSGKLAETMPLDIRHTPAHRYFTPAHDDVEYRESLFVGYRYYETYNVPVRYPFGYGLSYTTFEYKDLKAPECFENNDISVTLTVKNTGTVSGAETVQLYILPEKENFLRSSIELKGFTKVFLNPGEEKQVTIPLTARSFSVYDTDKGAFSVVGGVYTIAAGASVRDLRLKTQIVVQGDKYFRDESELFPDYFKPQPEGMEIAEEQFEALYGRPLSNFSQRKRGDYDINCSFADVASKSLVGNIFKFGVGIGLKFMFPGKSKNDPSYKMVRTGLSEGNLEGLIANSGGMISKKLCDFLVLNANRHYFKAIKRLFVKEETD